MSNERERKKPEANSTRVETDDRGRSVWADTVATGKFELLSTQELRTLLDSNDEQGRRSIEEAAATEKEGVLVRNAETGQFQIIDETDLQSLLDDDFSLPEQDRPADVTLDLPTDGTDDAENLSLVSTRALRKIMLTESDDAAEPPEEEPGGGFDPYNRT